MKSLLDFYFTSWRTYENDKFFVFTSKLKSSTESVRFDIFKYFKDSILPWGELFFDNLLYMKTLYLFYKVEQKVLQLAQILENIWQNQLIHRVRSVNFLPTVALSPPSHLSIFVLRIAVQIELLGCFSENGTISSLKEWFQIWSWSKIIWVQTFLWIGLLKSTSLSPYSKDRAGRCITPWWPWTLPLSLKQICSALIKSDRAWWAHWRPNLARDKSKVILNRFNRIT